MIPRPMRLPRGRFADYNDLKLDENGNDINCAGHVWMIRDLYETHILVADLERSRAFYEGLLGLEVGWIDESERRLLYWVGGTGKAMLGLREVPADQVSWQHFAFEVSLDDMSNAVSFLKDRGIACHNRIDGGESLQVFGWMPAVAIYFNDPDGHLLEFISMLPDAPQPSVGLVPWDEWNRTHGGEKS